MKTVLKGALAVLNCFHNTSLNLILLLANFVGGGVQDNTITSADVPASVASLVAAIGTTKTDTKPGIENPSLVTQAAGSPVAGWYLRDISGNDLAKTLGLNKPDFSQPGHPRGYYSAYTLTKAGDTWVVTSGDQGCIIPANLLPKPTAIKKVTGAALKGWSLKTTFATAATSFGTGSPYLQTTKEFLGEGQPPIFSLSYNGDQIGIPFFRVSLDTALVAKDGKASSQGLALRMSGTSDTEATALKKIAKLLGVQRLKVGKFRNGPGKIRLGEVTGAPLSAYVVRYGSRFGGIVLYSGKWSDKALGSS